MATTTRVTWPRSSGRVHHLRRAHRRRVQGERLQDQPVRAGVGPHSSTPRSRGGGSGAGRGPGGSTQGLRRPRTENTSRRRRPRCRPSGMCASTSHRGSGSGVSSSPSCPRRSRARSGASSCAPARRSSRRRRQARQRRSGGTTSSRSCALAAEQRRLRRGTARVPFAGLRSSAQTFGALRRPSTVCAAGRQPARIVGQSARRPRAPTTVPRTTTSGVSACVPVRTRSRRPSVALPVTMSAMTTATRTSRTRAAT